jgi:peptide/nickel transport system substrate-binding protein
MKSKSVLLSLALAVLVVAAASGSQAAMSKGKRIDKLTIALGAFGTEAIDPVLGILDDKPYLRLMYNYVIDTDLEDKDVSKVTGLAKDWKWSADRKALRVFLRKGVKFHNGAEVKAEDVVFSLRRMRGKDVRGPYTKFFFNPLDRMEVVNDYEVLFRLKKKPKASFLAMFGPILAGTTMMIYPKAYFEKVGKNGFRRKPIGSGPYKLVRREAGAYMEFEAFDDYFLGPPDVKKIIFRLVPEETTRIAMLKRGEVDIAEVSRENSDSIKKAGFKIFGKAGGDMIHLLPHAWPGDKTFKDPRVRKALFTSINKKEINKYILKGQGQLTGNILYEGIAVGGKKMPPHPYNPKAAAKLLREAGYPKGKLKVTLYAILKTGYPESADVAQAIAADWEKIGVITKIIPEKYGTLRPRIIKRTLPSPSLRIHPLGSRPFHGGLLRVFYSCPVAKLTVVCVPKVHEMIKKVNASNTTKEYGERQQAVAEVINKKHMGTMLHVVGRLMAANKKVKKWDLGSSAYSINFRYLGLRGLLEK